MKKIVILEIPHAQESNQLIQHVHFDAYCYLNGAIFINPKFSYLSRTRVQGRGIIFEFYLKILTLKISRKILIKLHIAKYHRFYAPDMKDQFNISNITYVKGWYFRNKQCFNEIKPYYIEKFNNRLKKEDFFENKRIFLVAIHIRRGDYRNFLGGKYFLNDNQYITALKNIIQELNEEYKIIVFGNDPDLDKKYYLDLGLDLFISEGSIYQDYYRMSNCDVVIGPSSTFSIWAQFISNGKLKKIVIDKDNYNKVRLLDAL